jgi:hypothetical protein
MSDSLLAIISVFALIVSVGAAIVTYWQTQLVRKSIESQTFLTILQRAREIDISSTLDLIGTFQYTDYAAYEKSAPESQQAKVRQAADFFNDLSHMIRGGYVDDLYPMRIYQPALLLCAKKLLPWWLNGIRAKAYPLLYQNFNWLCDYAAFLESEKAKTPHREIPKVGYKSYLKLQGVK